LPEDELEDSNPNGHGKWSRPCLFILASIGFSFLPAVLAVVVWIAAYRLISNRRLLLGSSFFFNEPDGLQPGIG
jgi:hypothetical protein